MSRAPRWPSQVLLLKGRMNFLTIRERIAGVGRLAKPAHCLAIGSFVWRVLCHRRGSVMMSRINPALD
jgi:hypothetical protein